MTGEHIPTAPPVPVVDTHFDRVEDEHEHEEDFDDEDRDGQDREAGQNGHEQVYVPNGGVHQAGDGGHDYVQNVQPEKEYEYVSIFKQIDLI